MTTKALAKITKLHPNTIRRLLHEGVIDAIPLGGRHGFEFGEDAPELVNTEMARRHKLLVEERRASGIMNGFRAKKKADA